MAFSFMRFRHYSRTTLISIGELWRETSNEQKNPRGRLRACCGKVFDHGPLLISCTNKLSGLPRRCPPQIIP